MTRGKARFASARFFVMFVIRVPPGKVFGLLKDCGCVVLLQRSQHFENLPPIIRMNAVCRFAYFGDHSDRLSVALRL